MKDLVVIVGTIVLGCMLFQLIAGDQNSLKSAAGQQMEKMIEQYERQ